MSRRFLRSAASAASFASFLTLAGTALAAPVYDTSAAGELTGSRSNGNPGVLLSGTSPPTSFNIAWVIDFNVTTPGLWHYKYTMTFTPPTTQAISHFILDLSDDCTALNGCVTNAQYPADPFALEFGVHNPSGTGNPNPNMLAAIDGIKFDNTIGDSPFVVEFDSVRAPVYGDFYTKAGSAMGGWQAQNSGINQHGTSENILDFIARPNGEEIIITVPAPMTLALFGLGLAGIGMARRRK